MLIYIREVRKALFKVNNCSVEACSIKAPCNSCQQLLFELLEWGQHDDYYESISIHSNTEPIVDDVGENSNYEDSELRDTISSMSTYNERSTEEGKVDGED